MPRPQSTSRWVTCVPLRAWTTVALPELPLPRLLKRSIGRAYFRSSAITCTMRWALAEVSGAPLALSTDTVVDSPWLLT